MTIIAGTSTQRQSIVAIPLPSDLETAGLMALASGIYRRAWRDARRSNCAGRGALRHRADARSFLEHDALSDAIGDVLDLSNHGEPSSQYMIEHRYFVELNDPQENGRRGLTDGTPIVIFGYIQPLKRRHKGIASVVIVEEPAGFALTWKAVPTDEWVALNGYKGPAGEISERKYARLLASVPGVPAEYRSAAWRRALDARTSAGTGGKAREGKK